MELKKLFPKQQAFVEAYAGNGTDAARIAGYKGNSNTLASVAKENLRKPHIWAAIQAREQTRADSRIATREERQAFWSSVLRDDVTQEIPDGDEVKIVKDPQQMKDRLKAAELLGKSEGDFIDRTELSGPEGGAIVTRESVVQELFDAVDGATRGLPKPVPVDE